MKVILHFYIAASYITLILCDVMDTSCKPRQIMKRIEATSYTPIFYLTFECSGFSVPSPSTKRCLSSSVTYLKFKYNYSDGEREFSYENHTSCEMKCVCGDCVSKGSRIVKCAEKFVWDNSTCDCVPDCKDDCKTNSMVSKTGAAHNEKGVSISTLILIMVAELVIVLIAVLLKFDTCKFRKHSTGVLYGAAKYLTGEKNKRRADLNRSGSVSLLSCDSLSTQRNT